jgi:hypothetical protein
MRDEYCRPIERAAMVLQRAGVPHQHALVITHDILEDLIAVIGGHFSKMSFADLANCEYSNEDLFTLVVYIPKWIFKPITGNQP